MATEGTGAAAPGAHATSRGRRAPWMVVAVAVVALGVGAFLVGSSLSTPSVQVLGRNAPVNAGAGDLLDIRSHNSPTLVRNPVEPEQLVVVNRVDTPRYSCGYHLSRDAGATWSDADLPFPAGEEEPPRCFAPDAAFAPDGTLHVVFVTLKGIGNTPNAAWIVSSHDGGRTLSTPSRLIGPLAFQVRISADPDDGERLYLSWLQAEATALFAFPTPGNPVLVSRSEDGGATWSPPVRVSPRTRQRVVAPSTAVGRRGAVHLLYLDVGDDALDYHGGHEGRGGPPYDGRWSLVLATSRDRGETWEETVVDRRVVPAARFLVFLPPSPSLAVDRRSGHVYVAFADARDGDADVRVWRSRGGARFSAPKRVNDTPRGDGTTQELPRLAVSPDGRLDVVYYDRRRDRDDARTEVSLQSSGDRGRTFGPRIRLSDRPFDSRIGFGAERGMPDLGNRLALLSTPDRAMAVWADTRAGTEASGKQDLASAVVAFLDGSAAREPLRAAGVGVEALGVAVLLWLAWAPVVSRRPPVSRT